MHHTYIFDEIKKQITMTVVFITIGDSRYEKEKNTNKERINISTSAYRKNSSLKKVIENEKCERCRILGKTDIEK
jgi:hypothetical protein